MKLLFYILLFLSTAQSFAQVDLSGTVTYPVSIGIDLIRVEGAEITIPPAALIYQTMYESFSYTGPLQVARVKGEHQLQSP